LTDRERERDDRETEREKECLKNGKGSRASPHDRLQGQDLYCRI
jgi:hypothetical protein